MWLTVTDAAGRTTQTADDLVVSSSAPTGAPTPSPTPSPSPSPTPTPSPGPTGSCDRNATPSTFASQVSAASSGQTVCLASGDYGTWQGVDKALTLRGAAGATAVLHPLIKSAVGLVLDGLVLEDPAGQDQGEVDVGNVTIRNSSYAGHALEICKNGSAPVMIDNVSFVGNTYVSTAISARLALFCDGTNVQVENSLFAGGDQDGIRADADGGLQIGPDNRFINLDSRDTDNHTDPIQLCCAAPRGDGNGPDGAHIFGNYFDESGAFVSAYIMVADGAQHMVIENNVFHTAPGCRPNECGAGYMILLYSDIGSVIRHNTSGYGTCDFNIPCGFIAAGHKSDQAAGSGTRIYDNVMGGVSGLEGGQRADHNLVAKPTSGTANVVGKPTFAGGSQPGSYSGYCLAPGSAGKHIADDGTDAGITGC